MKTLDIDPNRSGSDTPLGNPGRYGPVSGAAILETTELRWFSDGRLPPAVLAWFVRDGSHTLFEERCDRYRIDGRRDHGVKLRDGKLLEHKVRRSGGGAVSLTGGPRGTAEVWHKRRPDGGHMLTSRAEPGLDVHKKIHKRRFSPDGSELGFERGLRPGLDAGCDVEVVAVSIGGAEAWSFAFAAYGPDSGRRASITACWSALVAGNGPGPVRRWSGLGPSTSYPAWLNPRPS